jgi:hypothetical protein
MLKPASSTTAPPQMHWHEPPGESLSGEDECSSDELGAPPLWQQPRQTLSVPPAVGLHCPNRQNSGQTKIVAAK